MGRSSQHGVCVGPSWNLSTWEETVLVGSPSGQWSSSHAFTFVTRSSPPTFLIVVDPVSKVATDAVTAQEPAAAPSMAEQNEDLNDVQWSLDVERTNPPHVGSVFHRTHRGQDAQTFEDLSIEAQQTFMTQGRVEWRAVLHSHYKHRARFVAFVEDSSAPH